MTAAQRLDRDRQAAPQVFERLREMIVSLVLPPGETLSRLKLAKDFGLSSTPIRDALMRLNEEGLVDVFPQHATVVSKIDIDAAQQAHFLRRSLELEIVRMLALEHEPGLIEELNRTMPCSSTLPARATSRPSWRRTTISTGSFTRRRPNGSSGCWCAVAVATSIA